jgi:hypothetical protein
MVSLTTKKPPLVAAVAPSRAAIDEVVSLSGTMSVARAALSSPR